MSLPSVLRIVGGLIVLMVIGEYVVLQQLMLPPLVVVAVLLGLSFAYGRWPTPVAWIAVVLSVLTPVAALNGYLQGKLPLVVPIFDAVIFAWVLWTAVAALRSRPNAQAA